MQRTKWAICPACRQAGQFQHNGDQRWPPAVAAAHSLPPTIALWTCPHCRTTLSETALLPPASRRPRRRVRP